MVVKGMKRTFVYGFILACLTLGASVLGAWSLFHETRARLMSKRQKKRPSGKVTLIE